MYIEENFTKISLRRLHMQSSYLDFDTSIKNNNPQSLENNGLAGF